MDRHHYNIYVCRGLQVNSSHSQVITQSSHHMINLSLVSYHTLDPEAKVRASREIRQARSFPGASVIKIAIEL